MAFLGYIRDTLPALLVGTGLGALFWVVGEVGSTVSGAIDPVVFFAIGFLIGTVGMLLRDEFEE